MAPADGTGGMADAETFVLGDDLPKENPWRDDRLGYKPFCERLSKVILSLKVPNGYVIGLHGEWGSGKSTALNFVRRFLEKHNQEAEADKDHITLVDFRPWIVSGHQDLIAAFFKVMSESLGPRSGFIRRQFNRLLRALKLGGDPLVDAVATVAVILDPTVGLASKAAVPVAKKSLGTMVDKFLADPSLQMAYEELKKRLADSGKRFLVTIDDLDRLHDEEIRSIMQMVKTVGQLPNVIYLLAYDRGKVWEVLDVERGGPRFAEKIVQQEIELPRPSKEALLSILDEKIDFLVGPPPDSVRWLYIVQDGARRWVRHPRDVIRLANATKFSWPALKGEIDPQDLLSMEGLRLFDGEAFDWVRWNRDFLFTEGRFVMSRDEIREHAVNQLRSRIPEAVRDQVIRVLAVLFPRQAKYLEGKETYSDEAQRDVLRRRGVGCEAGYDAYFGLHPSSDAIPKAVIDGIIEKREDEEALVATMAPFIEKRHRTGQPMMGQLLEEVRVRYRGKDAVQPTQQMLDALMKLGEPILRLETWIDVFTVTARRQWALTIEALLEGWQSKAAEQLKAAFDTSDSAAVCAEIFVDRARDLGIFRGEGRLHNIIDMDALKALGDKLLPKIEAAAAQGTLAHAPFYMDIVRAWAYLDNASTPKAWIAEGINTSAEFLAKVSMGLVSYSMSAEGRSYRMDGRPDPELYDLNLLLAACKKHLAGRELNEDQRQRINVVAEGLEGIIAKDASLHSLPATDPGGEQEDKGEG